MGSKPTSNESVKKSISCSSQRLIIFSIACIYERKNINDIHSGQLYTARKNSFYQSIIIRGKTDPGSGALSPGDLESKVEKKW